MNSMLARCWPVLLAVLFSVTAAHADAVQGRDYRLLAPTQPGAHPGKVEVIEFFSYGCPHCAHFHPSVTKWASELPSNAVFVRVPVSFGRREWGQLVRAYYALEATGQLARFDGALFEAIHEQRKPLFTEERLASWIAEQGGDAAKFREAFNSFDVSRHAQRAEQLSRDYRVSGVPQLTVAGKYVVLGQTFEDMLRIATELVTTSQPEAAAQTH